jgi:hypothetical protein
MSERAYSSQHKALGGFYSPSRRKPVYGEVMYPDFRRDEASFAGVAVLMQTRGGV